VELFSTMNMLSYNAPDIYPRGRSSTTSSAASSVGSRTTSSSNSDGSPSSVNTAFTTPDASSIESSPTSTSPKPNHLSCYFGSPVPSDDEAPKIPTRALSHTKKSAEYLARKRSMSRMSSPKNSISRITSPKSSISMSRSSIQMFSPNSQASDLHPFGNELAQVSELVEEYGSSKERLPGKMTVIDEEEQELVSKGLFKFAADDYMSELQGLFISAFGDMPMPQPSTVWI